MLMLLIVWTIFLFLCLKYCFRFCIDAIGAVRVDWGPVALGGAVMMLIEFVTFSIWTCWTFGCFILQFDVRLFGG